MSRDSVPLTVGEVSRLTNDVEDEECIVCVRKKLIIH